MLRHKTELPEQTFIQLVRDLFDTLMPTVIATICVNIVAILVVFEKPDALLIGVSTLAVIASVGRIAVLLYYRREATDKHLTRDRARRIEMHFKFVYLGFAVCFASFLAAAYTRSSVDVQTVVIALIFGYGANVAASLSVRPGISIPSIVIATSPMILATVHQSHLAGLVLGFLLAVFLAGGVHAIIVRYRVVSTRITMIGIFASLARNDHLTGLGNRLALREAFETYTCAFASGDGGVALLCLDLDRFKPVNDLYGHPVGDALLVAVAARLRNVLRKSDFAARLGGDEFVVVQTQVRHSTEVEMLARRIVRDVAEPYMIEGHEISIGTSIGYVISAQYGNLDDLTTCADQALYRAKRQGCSIACYETAAVSSRDVQELALVAKL